MHVRLEMQTYRYREDSCDNPNFTSADSNNFGRPTTVNDYRHWPPRSQDHDYTHAPLGQDDSGESLSNVPMIGVGPELVLHQTVRSAQWNALMPLNANHEQVLRANITPIQSNSRPLEGDNGAPKRRIPPAARRLLEESFQRHRRDPYIPQYEIQELVALTRLTIRQVRTFFANARARKLPPASSIDQPGFQNDSVQTRQLEPQVSPIGQVLSSCSEGENMTELPVPETMTRLSPQTVRERQPSAALSVSGYSNAESPNSCVANVEQTHNRDANPIRAPGPRRGRKRRRESTATQLTSVVRRPSNPSRKYQCTFCPLDFVQKYDWQRHEDSVHFPQKEWVCLPDGPLDQYFRCVFCNKDQPDKRHLDSHKSVVCSEAPRAQRAFLRKDKLIQHIKQVHACQAPKAIKEWSRPVERNVIMMCGLCMRIMPDWGTRANHIASHFNDGVGMDMWLLERPGGIMKPELSPIGNSLLRISKYYAASSTPKGKILCEFCPSTFKYTSNLISHRRQVHNSFRIEDTTKIYWPSLTSLDPSDAASLASNMDLSGIQKENTDTAAQSDPQQCDHTSQSTRGQESGIPSRMEHRIRPSSIGTVTENPSPVYPRVQASLFATVINRRNPALGSVPTPSKAYDRSSTPPSYPTPAPLSNSHLHPNDQTPRSSASQNLFRPQHFPANPSLYRTGPNLTQTLSGERSSRLYVPAPNASEPGSLPRSKPFRFTTDELRALAQKFRNRGMVEEYPRHGMLHGIEQHAQGADAHKPWPSPYDPPEPSSR